MGGDDDVFTGLDVGEDMFLEVGDSAISSIFKTLAIRWSDIITSSPDMHLLCADLFTQVIFILAL